MAGDGGAGAAEFPARRRRRSFMGLFVAIAIVLAVGLALLFLLGWVLHWLWNTTMPDVFGWKPITVVQAIKLMFIASILFGGHRVVRVEQAAEIATEQAGDAAEAPAQ
jgi:hypothetical protein